MPTRSRIRTRPRARRRALGRLAAAALAAAVALLSPTLPLAAQPAELAEPAATPAPFGSLAHTYSIVAKDPATGNLGVAVQSHWFQVGTAVPWAEAGVGAVATQSFVEVSYGPKGLALMRQGVPAPQALEWLIAQDPQRDVRQVAFVDAEGRVAAWTGKKCISAAGDETGEQFSVQANLMDKDTVWPAMAKAYREAVAHNTGDFAERLLLALEAAQAEGGDIRGRQSAALLIVQAAGTGEPWKDKVVDLRVDDSSEPLVELRRLLVRHRAYEDMNAGDEAMATGEIEKAVELYSRAAESVPEIVELPFWQAVTLFSVGREEEALPIFRQVFAKEPDWARLVPRLPASDLLPGEPEKIEKILGVAP